MVEQLPCKEKVQGSSPCFGTTLWDASSTVEHSAFNRQVQGSNPWRPTNFMFLEDIDQVIERIIDTEKLFNPVNYTLADQNYFHNAVFKCEICNCWRYLDEESDTIGVCINCEE